MCVRESVANTPLNILLLFQTISSNVLKIEDIVDLSFYIEEYLYAHCNKNENCKNQREN